MEESVCSTHQVAGSFKLLFEVTMKNTDILNIKPVSLLFLLLLFKLGFVEYLKKCIYIKKKKGHRSPSGCGILFSDLNGKFAQSLDSRTGQYCGCTCSKSSWWYIFFLVKNMLETKSV